MRTRLLLLALPLLVLKDQAEADDCILAAAAGEIVTLRRFKSELPAHCHSLFSRVSAASTIAAAASLVDPQVYALDVHLNASSLNASSPLPSSSPLHSSSAPPAPFITSLFASWVVPMAPTDWYGFSDKNYLWPGLKSQSPTIGFPVIQPVLQYVHHCRAPHSAVHMSHSLACGISGERLRVSSSSSSSSSLCPALSLPL